MPSRNLPEATRAREQLDRRLLRRIRFLERRVRYPGRLRSVQVGGGGFVPIPVPSTEYVYASLDLPAGRWKIDSVANYLASGVLHVEIYPLGYDRDGVPTTEQNENHELGYGQWFADSGAEYRVTTPTIGSGVWPDGGRVDLTISVTSPFTPALDLEVSWLFATPI